MSKPLLVGITGGIGAGKSLIAKVFESLGTSVYNADTRAKWLMTNSRNIISAIKVIFGDESYIGNELNRVHISSLAFHKPKLLTQLNALVHPEVELDFENWVDQNIRHRYLLKEASLLIEAGSCEKLDKLILVTAPENIRMKRILSRDNHRTEQDTEAIMRKQLSDEEKKKKSDIILANNGTFLLIPQILKLHEEFSQ